jgi:hypothetical protein
MTNEATLSVSEIAANIEIIEADTYTDAQLDALGAVHDKFAYTSTVLTALADHLAGLGDTTAQLMLLRMAGEMANHEARNI